MNQARIPSLPPPLQAIPDNRTDWLDWRQRVLAWRDVVHQDCRDDPHMAALHYELAAEDPAYFLVMFCPIYEARETIDYEWDDNLGQWVEFEKPSGWYPWVPFHFQVEMLRWIVKVTQTSRIQDKTGKGDGVVEKSREMGASWVFCALAAHEFLFGRSREVGFISYAEYVVTKKNDPRSLFYKVRALIGVNPVVPERSYAPGTLWDQLNTSLPPFLVPQGWDKKVHDLDGQLTHPTNGNVIIGNTTSSRTGTGARWSWCFIDEGAKNDKFLDIWGNVQAVTYHRLSASSVDLTYGDDFYRLARNAEKAMQEGAYGPAFMSLPWALHPLRDEGWLEAERARSDLDPHQFAREYEMDYHAGFGDWVYPFGQQMSTRPSSYVAGQGQVYGGIDPAVADPSAIHLFQDVPGAGRVKLFDSITLSTPSAEMLAPILMGFPIGHPEFEECPLAARDFMVQMWGFRQRGEKVTWVGDPYGAASGGSGSETFYESLLRASQEKSLEYPDLPQRHIVVHYDYDDKARYHPGRKEALTNLLPFLDINDNFGGNQFLAALQSHRYKAEDKANAERLKPEHGWGSHAVTAAEFFAVHRRAVSDVARFRQRGTPGPHLPSSPSHRAPQKPRQRRVA